MLTIALHQDESVFVHLSGAQKGKKKIEKIGLFSPDFSFDRPFIYQQSSKNLLSEMLREILDVLPVKQQEVYFSFPGELAYVTVYDDVKQDEIKTIVDKDIWLAEKKFGNELVSASDCQVKVVYKDNGLARITPIYFPKRILEVFTRVCHENNCKLVGLGINIFNSTEIAKKLTKESDYVILSYEAGQYELTSIKKGILISYARFSAINNKAFYLLKSGNVPEELCDAVIRKDTTVLDSYGIFITGTSHSLEHLRDLQQLAPDMLVLNPMNINSAYSKPTVEYDRRYNTVFSSALGALI